MVLAMEGEGSSSAGGGGGSSEAASAYSHDRRIMIYPAYFNSKITTAEGRKMPIAHCCEYPTVFEIVEVLKHLGYESPLIEVMRHRRLQPCPLRSRWCLSLLSGWPRDPGRTRRILAATLRRGAACACS